MAIDPVCGMQVDEQKAQNSTHFEQHAYYFCSAECKADFERDPRQYVNPDGSIIKPQTGQEEGGYMRGGEGVHTSGLSHDERASGRPTVPPRPQQAQSPAGSQQASGKQKGQSGKQKKFGT